MKTIIILITFLSIASVSCEKNDKKPSGIPEVTMLTPRCEGGTVKSIAFPFEVRNNGATIKSIELFKSPSIKISENLNVSNDGTYTLYHSQQASCPQQSDNAMYYLVLTKGDDTKITTATKHVYF
jgi:hypothetical protein